MSKNTGGPAFPCMWENNGERNALAPNGEVVPPGASIMLPGMTLRDYFAAKAMESDLIYQGLEGRDDLQHVAAMAYEMADAMLKEREK